MQTLYYLATIFNIWWLQQFCGGVNNWSPHLHHLLHWVVSCSPTYPVYACIHNIFAQTKSTLQDKKMSWYSLGQQHPRLFSPRLTSNLLWTHDGSPITPCPTLGYNNGALNVSHLHLYWPLICSLPILYLYLVTTNTSTRLCPGGIFCATRTLLGFFLKMTICVVE